MLRCLIALLALLPLAGMAATPRIVVSLPPLHALVTGVTGEAAEPHLLLRGGASPHTFSLAPSDVRALSNADLIVAADLALEGFLERPLESLAADAEVIWLTRAPGVHRRTARAGDRWESHDHAHGDDRDDEHDESHTDENGRESVDPHAWLDPRNAIALTRELADQLARLDPDLASQYRGNAEQQIERLRRLDAELEEQLAPLRDMPYLVFHDAYQYFEARYGLRPIGAVAIDADRPPGAHRVADLHDRIEQTGARCLFAEPQFRPKIVNVIERATGIRSATLDPLGATLEPGPELYFRLMRDLADGLVGCLGEPAAGSG